MEQKVPEGRLALLLGMSRLRVVLNYFGGEMKALRA